MTSRRYLGTCYIGLECELCYLLAVVDVLASPTVAERRIPFSPSRPSRNIHATRMRKKRSLKNGFVAVVDELVRMPPKHTGSLAFSATGALRAPAISS